jgi:hypothetical protein
VSVWMPPEIRPRESLHLKLSIFVQREDTRVLIEELKWLSKFHHRFVLMN